MLDENGAGFWNFDTARGIILYAIGDFVFILWGDLKDKIGEIGGQSHAVDMMLDKIIGHSPKFLEQLRLVADEHQIQISRAAPEFD